MFREMRRKTRRFPRRGSVHSDFTQSHGVLAVAEMTAILMLFPLAILRRWHHHFHCSMWKGTSVCNTNNPKVSFCVVAKDDIFPAISAPICQRHRLWHSPDSGNRRRNQGTFLANSGKVFPGLYRRRKKVYGRMSRSKSSGCHRYRTSYGKAKK